jgi:phosphatidylglycerol---prolipoprotein diacylglyceryl transferase
MRPVLFAYDLAGHEVTVTSYTFFLVAAAITAVGLGSAIARKRGTDGRKSLVCLTIGLTTTIVGARWIHWLTNPGSFDGTNAVLSLGRSNLSGYAGLLVGVMFTAIFARLMGVNPWRLADSATPAVALAAALARVGCLLNGCCYGQPTRAPWGIACPTGSNAHASQVMSGAIGLLDAPMPVHPTQLYEAVAALLGVLIALWLLRRMRIDGIAFLVFAIWFTSFRWVNHYLLSTPTSADAPQWLYPAVYALVLVICGSALARIRR